MNINITGGSVSVEDGIPAKTGDFDPKRKVKVELAFTVPEGTDAQPVLTFASKMAHDQVLTLLGKKPATDTAVVAPAAAAPASKVETAAEKKARIAAEKAATAPKKELTDKDKLAQAAGLPVDGDELTSDAPAAKPAEDDLGDLLGDTAPVPVTDAELGKAAQETNARLKSEHGEKHNPAVIRKLITDYAGENKKITDIPAAKRHDFVAALKALK